MQQTFCDSDAAGAATPSGQGAAESWLQHGRSASMRPTSRQALFGDVYRGLSLPISRSPLSRATGPGATDSSLSAGAAPGNQSDGGQTGDLRADAGSRRLSPAVSSHISSEQSLPWGSAPSGWHLNMLKCFAQQVWRFSRGMLRVLLQACSPSHRYRLCDHSPRMLNCMHS